MRPSNDVCKSDGGSMHALYYEKNFYRETTPLKMYIYKSCKLNETLRFNRYEKPFSPFFCTENFVINWEQNLFSRNHLLYFHYVIKELVHAFSCAYIELWMHLGSLESTQEARVARGIAESNSYASLVLSKLPTCSIT